MAWPFDESKLNRVRALMKDQDVSALVVRAPDNVLYLTNYWCMKGYDAVVFPQEGDPTLIVLEPQLADAQRNSWTEDLKLFKGYDERDPRPAPFRSLDLALETLKQRGLTDKVALELNMGTQSADRMVGEPTTPTQFFFDAFRKVSGHVVDATPLLSETRAIKTAQEVERMRLANELAALAMDYTRKHMKPGACTRASCMVSALDTKARSRWREHSRWSGRGRGSRPLLRPVIAPSRRTNLHSSKSGYVWMATGPT